MMRFGLLGLLLPFTVSPSPNVVANDVVPGPPQTKPVALVGATIHTVAGATIRRGTLVFEKGRITAVGRKVEIPEEAERIDLKGKHVYPGLIESSSNVGLVEVNAVRASRDERETGTLNPNVKSWVAVNPDSELIPVMRANGVLLAVSAPSGGLVAGQSAMLQLDGWTYEDLVLQAPLGMQIEWPRIQVVRPGLSGEEVQKRTRERDDRLKKLGTLFDEARAYRVAKRADPERPVDARLEAMLPVLAGKLPLIVLANEVDAIRDAVAFAVREDVKLILLGGYDAPLVANLLKEHDVPVIVGGVHILPQRRSEPYDTPFTVADRLRRAGVRYAISGGNRFGASATRNLPYHAAHAVAFGLPTDEALKAITLYPAEILGVGKRVGSLEVGKDATLFVASGDILETETQVEDSWIQGRRLHQTDKHRQLFEKYREKYRQLGER